MGLFKTFFGARTVAAPTATDEFLRLDNSGDTQSSTWTQMKDDVLTDVASQYASLANPTFTGNVVVPNPDADAEALNRITADGRFKRQTNDRIWISAGAMSAYLSTPTLTAGTFSAFWQTWLLNKTAGGEGIATSMIMPSTWTTFDAYVWHVLPAAGTGNWRSLFIYNAGVTTGDAQDAGVAAAINVIAAGALNVVQRTLVKSAAAVTGGELLLVRLARVDSASADTLTPDIAILGIELVGNPT